MLGYYSRSLMRCPFASRVGRKSLKDSIVKNRGGCAMASVFVVQGALKVG